MTTNEATLSRLDAKHADIEEETGCDYCGYEDCRCDDEPDDSLEEWLADLRAER